MRSLGWTQLPFPAGSTTNLRFVDATAVLIVTALLLRTTVAHATAAAATVERHHPTPALVGPSNESTAKEGEKEEARHHNLPQTPTTDCSGEDSQEQHPNRPLKICILVEPSPFSYTSGYANRFQELIRYLVQHGDTVQVITTEAVNVHNRVSEWHNVPIHYTFGVRLPWYPLLSVSLDWTLQIPRVLHRFQPDLIHVSSPGLLVLAAALYARLFNIPLVASYHTHLPVYVRSHYLCNAPPWVKRVLERLVWKLIGFVHGGGGPLGFGADLTVVPSPQIRDELIAHANINPHKIHVWTKGIDTERFHPHFRSEQWRQQLEELLPAEPAPGTASSDSHPLPLPTFWLLYVGRLGREKRLNILKDVLQQLPRHAALCFVGTGPYESELQRHFHNTRTIFVGQLHDIHLSQAFASADVFVMPSDSETLGFVVLESIASSVPVVALKAGGLIDLIDDNVTGYLIDPTNNAEDEAHHFARRIRALMEDPMLRENIGTNARKATLLWSWEASMAELRSHDYPAAIQNFHCRPSRRSRSGPDIGGSTLAVLEGVHEMQL